MPARRLDPPLRLPSGQSANCRPVGQLVCYSLHYTQQGGVSNGRDASSEMLRLPATGELSSRRVRQVSQEVDALTTADCSTVLVTSLSRRLLRVFRMYFTSICKGVFVFSYKFIDGRGSRKVLQFCTSRQDRRVLSRLLTATTAVPERAIGFSVLVILVFVVTKSSKSFVMATDLLTRHLLYLLNSFSCLINSAFKAQFATINFKTKSLTWQSRSFVWSRLIWNSIYESNHCNTLLASLTHFGAFRI